MCLVKDPEHLEHDISPKGGIRVFKLMKDFGIITPRNMFVSPFSPYGPISLGQTMRPSYTFATDYMDRQSSLGAGVIHSYNDFDTCKMILENDLLPYADAGEIFYIIECTIPEGIPYWVDKNGIHCASTELVLEKIVLARNTNVRLRHMIVW